MVVVSIPLSRLKRWGHAQIRDIQGQLDRPSLWCQASLYQWLTFGEKLLEFVLGFAFPLVAHLWWDSDYWVLATVGVMMVFHHLLPPEEAEVDFEFHGHSMSLPRLQANWFFMWGILTAIHWSFVGVFPLLMLVSMGLTNTLILAYPVALFIAAIYSWIVVGGDVFLAILAMGIVYAYLNKTLLRFCLEEEVLDIAHHFRLR